VSADQAARPSAPSTVAELERSARLVAAAVTGAVLLIVALTVALVVGLDLEPIPVIPIAALVIAVDVWFLITFRRQRREALEQLRRDQAGIG